MKATTVEQSTKIFMNKYERPGIPHEGRRIKASQGFKERVENITYFDN
mgnify:CR=1 FL=1